MKGYRLQLTVYSLLFFLLSPSACCLPPTFAAESTSSASPSAQTISKLEALKAEIASKAAKLKQEISQKLQNRAYIGIVKSRSDQSMTIASKSGSKIININQDTVFESKIKSKTKASLKTIVEDDTVATLGDIDETGVLTAKKIVLLAPDSTKPKAILWTEVKLITNKKIVVKDRSSKSYKLLISSETVIKRDGNKAAVDSLKEGDQLVVTGFLQDDQIDTSLIYIINQGLSFKKNEHSDKATSSAKESTSTPKKR